jgi:hypothetical protein
VACSEVVKEIGIFEGSSANWLATRRWHVGRELFLRVSIDAVCPVVFDMVKS